MPFAIQTLNGALVRKTAAHLQFLSFIFFTFYNWVIFWSVLIAGEPVERQLLVAAVLEA